MVSNRGARDRGRLFRRAKTFILQDLVGSGLLVSNSSRKRLGQTQITQHIRYSNVHPGPRIHGLRIQLERVLIKDSFQCLRTARLRSSPQTQINGHLLCRVVSPSPPNWPETCSTQPINKRNESATCQGLPLTASQKRRQRERTKYYF